MYFDFPISFSVPKLKIRPDREVSSNVLGKLSHERQRKATNYITKQRKPLETEIREQKKLYIRKDTASVKQE